MRLHTELLPAYDHHPGDGPTLVFLHYWGGSACTWSPVVARLPHRDILTLDFRGWGRSRAMAGPYSLAQFAADTLAIVDREGLTDFVLVGHSMGGKVAQLVAARRPAGLCGVILVAPAPALPPGAVTPDYQQQLAHAYDCVDSISEVRDQILTATTLSSNLRDQVVADSLAAGADARRDWPLHGISLDITEATGEHHGPTLVVAGEHDRVEPPDVLRTHLLPYLAEVAMTVIPGSGHLIPLEAPDELAAAIRDFGPVNSTRDPIDTA